MRSVGFEVKGSYKGSLRGPLRGLGGLGLLRTRDKKGLDGLGCWGFTAEGAA